MERLTQLFDAYTNAQLADCLTGDGTSPYGLEPAALSVQELLDTAKGILTCAYYLKDSVRGFDCYVTEDGEHFETITTDGLGDPYNHGLGSLQRQIADFALVPPTPSMAHSCGE